MAEVEVRWLRVWFPMKRRLAYGLITMPRDPQVVPNAVNNRWYEMVMRPAPIVPVEEDRG